MLVAEILHQRVGASNHASPFLVHVVPQMQGLGVVEAGVCVPDLIVAPPLWVGDGVKSLGVEKGQVRTPKVICPLEVFKFAPQSQHPCHQIGSLVAPNV